MFVTMKAKHVVLEDTRDDGRSLGGRLWDSTPLKSNEIQTSAVHLKFELFSSKANLDHTFILYDTFSPPHSNIRVTLQSMLSLNPNGYLSLRDRASVCVPLCHVMPF